MIAYKFKVYLSSDKKVHREIRILDEQTFKELHHTMMKAYQLNKLTGASFYNVDDKWQKKERIALTKPAADTETLTMDNHTIGEFVEGKKSKFTYECKADEHLYAFNLELIDTEKDIDLDSTGRFPKWDDTSGLKITIPKKKVAKPVIEDDDDDDDFEGDSFGKGFDDVKIEDQDEEAQEESKDFADEPYEEDDEDDDER